MDKIVELIIVFYFISAFLRFLKKSQQRKDHPSHPVPHKRPAPPPLPPQTGTPTGREEPMQPGWREPMSPYPSRSRMPGTPPSGPPVLTPREREALDILAEWEHRARARRGGAKEPQIPPGRGTSPGRIPEVPSPTRAEIPAAKRPPLQRPTQPGAAPGTIPGKAPSVAKPATMEAMEVPVTMKEMDEEFAPTALIEPAISREKGAEGKIVYLSHPDMLWQGIVMSEILRPPVARRAPFLPPYLRG
ncbi:MAG: hypothetical protein AB1847_12710 [bacterium]